MPHYHVEGTLKILGNNPSKLKLGREFKGWYGVYVDQEIIATIRPKKRLELTHNGTGHHCRDQLIPALANTFSAFCRAYPNLRLSAIGDLKFRFIFNDQNQESVDKAVRLVTKGLLGNGVNRDFTPLCSPFILRHVIGEVTRYHKLYAPLRSNASVESIRKVMNMNKTEFAKLMFRADEKDIRLNENLAEAWDLRPAPMKYAYGWMGIRGLYSLTSGYDTISHDYAKAFPPYSLLKE